MPQSSTSAHDGADINASFAIMLQSGSRLVGIERTALPIILWQYRTALFDRSNTPVREMR
ncbi:hypothetical protein DKP76_02610 [Falsochrobactrum shanghaiense]|uniref:Uncharacterized protein n=1 Tax=Falsochrobactrum shanghaiense TaxID=2201899 RepID=A0A316JDD5_9HYPH|nr:hypothetical protein DKP76_02610 [Falsochrobactrum shanghaiense]